MKALIVVLFVLLSNWASAQTSQPAFSDIDLQLQQAKNKVQSAYQGFHAVYLASTQPVSPSTQPVTENWYPSPVLNLPVDEKIYVDADNGNDTTGNGTIAAPYRTNAPAFARAKADMASGAAKHPGVYDFAPATQPYDPIPPNGIEWTRYGNTDPEQRPKVIITDVGAIFLNAKNVSIHDLEFDGPASPAAPANYGFYANGAVNVYVTDNVFRNCVMGVTLIGACSNVHVTNNALAGGWPGPAGIGKTQMCSAIYTEVNAPDLSHNFLYHWGYLEGWDWTNPSINIFDQFYHGLYGNPGGGWAVAPTMYGIFAWSCGSTGVQGRTSGSNIDSCLFICNGHDVDAFVGVGYDQTLHDGKTWDVETPGSITNCVVLGTQRNQPPDWAGGLGLYCRGTIKHCRFLSDSTFQINPAVQVRQNNAPYAPDFFGQVIDCDGIWTHAAVAADPNIPTASVTQTNVTIRQPRPGEHVPNIYDYVSQFGVAGNEHDASEWFITHRHSYEASTDAALAYFQGLKLNP